MTFRELLAKIVDQTPGAVSGVIMGIDGIAVDDYRTPQAEIDLTAVAVEFQRVLGEAGKVAGTLYGDSRGSLEELVLVTRGHQLLFRQIDDEYFLVVALTTTGVLGKARYLIRTLLEELRAEL